MKTLKIIAAIFIAVSAVNAAAQGTFKPAERVFVRTSDYVNSFFNGEPPKKSTVWVVGELRDDINKIINGADSTPVRYRYWQEGDRTLWVLDSIGHSNPITAGIVVEDNKILDISVLIYRETRGHEIQGRHHRTQYYGTFLDNNNNLNSPINGISGSTLSVNALKRMARIALLLHNNVTEKEE